MRPVIVFVCLLVAACGAPGDVPDFMKPTLDALTGAGLSCGEGKVDNVPSGLIAWGSPDRGWQFIYPRSQEIIGSAGDYTRAAQAADWSAFDLSIWEVGVLGGQYRIEVTVPDHESAVPEFLRGWSLIQFDKGDTGRMVLRIPPGGSEFGILAG